MTPAARLHRAAVAFFEAEHCGDEAKRTAADRELRDVVDAYDRAEAIPANTAIGVLTGTVYEISPPRSMRVLSTKYPVESKNPDACHGDNLLSLVLEVDDGKLPGKLYAGDPVKLTVELLTGALAGATPGGMD